MTAFTPRSAFSRLDSLPRSYFLGHHRSGLQKIKSLVPSVDLFIECRDYRAPLVSRNPLFEEHIADKSRLIVYTKHDLGGKNEDEDKSRKSLLINWHRPVPVVFSNGQQKAAEKILSLIRTQTASNMKLTGPRTMVVGMPNVGKSSLLNALRRHGVGKGKAARTGAQPGVTRAIASSVKILDGEDESEQVYMFDTPGVFVPYAPNPESMLKLALCGSVKDTIISPTIVADYLLYRLNLVDPLLYKHYTTPTNDVNVFLDAIARKTGRLGKGAVPEVDGAALWIVQRWRNGHLGRFVLEEVSRDTLNEDKIQRENMEISINQARKKQKEAKQEQFKLRALGV